MKIKKIIPWTAFVPWNHNRSALLGLITENIRFLYSKTGIWDKQLTPETRLEIEKHWKPIVQLYDEEQSKLSESPLKDSKEKFYALSMFPYPSGNLHLGHVRVYTISDIMSRYHRSQGKIVIHPMGWDAFGLPAENAAMERGIPPKEWTYSNIKRMKQQLKDLGFSFDWNRELATCDPSYYRWTQFIFLKMFEAGLAFQKKGLVNWDPVDMTVLAHEQIDEHGCSWRSGAKVEKKYLTQWFLRDTSFSESLLKGLDEVDANLWKDIITIQKNWISECNGHRIDFKLKSEAKDCADFPLTVYTEDLDLVYGVSHLCIKPSHYLCVDFNRNQVDDVLPVQAIHPLTGEYLKIVVTKEDQMYKNREVKLAIPCISEEDREVADRLNISYTNVLDGTNTVHATELCGLNRKDALEVVRKKLVTLGAGGEKISEQLHDWLISRQRYWGTPIPIIHCGQCGSVPVPYEDLPVTLPDTSQLILKAGQSVLAEDEKWINVPCPKCGSAAKRETDTMDTFVDSTWYFLRYLDPHNTNLPFDPDRVKQFMPVDLYVGGKEHALLHLYYARFVSHFFHSIGLLEHKEPFKNLISQGMVKGESYRVKATGKYIPADQVDFSGKSPVEMGTKEKLIVEFEKMSKSKHNGVNPEEVVAEYGIDSTRLCILSNVSPQSERNWSNSVYKGVISWQCRVWGLVTRVREESKADQTKSDQYISELDLKNWEYKINETRNHIVHQVTIQFEKLFCINAAISRLQSYVSWLMQVPASVSSRSEAFERAVADLVIMISPMAPHFASELWVGLSDVAQHNSHQWENSVLQQAWPKIDDDFLVPLTFKVNNVAVADIGVQYSRFGQLDKEAALELVLKDSLFCEKFSNYHIQSCTLSKFSTFKAEIRLNIPDYEFPIEATSVSEEKKMQKKLSKEKRKLYDIEKK
ncbi:probable leucine--tRNA ligase, mitochondrial isoform X2 [Physella acuta]|nr:probable leucine--tRNA ligase, mitochondrial isoform X2 [Physella acuta]